MTWVLALCLAIAPPASPEPQRPSAPVVWGFAWQAPEGCPKREAVIEAIQNYLPDVEIPPETPGFAKLRVETTVHGGEGDWRATVRTSGLDGDVERTFSAPTCAALADAVALISATALDRLLTSHHMPDQDPPRHGCNSQPREQPIPLHLRLRPPAAGRGDYGLASLSRSRSSEPNTAAAT